VQPGRRCATHASLRCAAGVTECINAIYTGEVLSLSEQQLIDCDRSAPWFDLGCQGGDVVGGACSTRQGRTQSWVFFVSGAFLCSFIMFLSACMFL
jgi:Papain family cysteine protease